MAEGDGVVLTIKGILRWLEELEDSKPVYVMHPEDVTDEHRKQATAVGAKLLANEAAPKGEVIVIEPTPFREVFYEEKDTSAVQEMFSGSAPTPAPTPWWWLH